MNSIIEDLYEALRAMRHARETPIVDDNFPRLIHEADRKMERAMARYERAIEQRDRPMSVGMEHAP